MRGIRTSLAQRLAAGLCLALLLAGTGMAHAEPAPAAEVLIKQAYRGIMGGPELRDLYAAQAEKPPYRGISVQRDVKYGPFGRDLLDVFTADGGAKAAARPVLLFMHGGAFLYGNKTSPGADGKPGPFFDNVMLWAARNGMVGVNIGYELAPSARFPQTQREIAAALDWIGAHAKEIGADPSRIYIMGHSSGAAQLAAYLGHEAYQSRFPVAGAILVSGLYDYTMPMVGLSYPGNGEAAGYFGEDPAKIAEATPIGGLMRSAAPMLIVTAELDPELFHDQARQLVQGLCTLGHCPAIANLRGHNHSSEMMSVNTADASLTSVVLRFLKSQDALGR